MKHSISSRQKVLIGIPCLLTGGTEIHTLHLVSALIAAGYQVVVCCYFEYESEMKKKMEDAGARVILLELKRNRRGKNYFKLIVLARALHRVFKEVQPYFFHVQYLAPGAFPVIWGKLHRLPRVLATLHTPGHMYKKTTFSIKFIASHVCDAFFCVSRTAEQHIFGDSSLFSEKAFLAGRRHFHVFNGVDVQRIARLIQEVDRSELKRRYGLGEGIVIGVTGRLNPVKGHAFLIDVFALLLKTQPNAELLVIGEGESLPSLQVQAQQLGIDEKIRWLGRLLPDDALRAYAVMDVVAVPSVFEGFGLSAAEAMAAGKPVVASDVDGLRDIVEQDRTGFLVGYGDKNAMCEALARLGDNRTFREMLGTAGEKRAMELFGMEQFHRNWQIVYKILGES